MNGTALLTKQIAFHLSLLIMRLKSLSKPSAVWCISAHWVSRGTFVTAMGKPQTIDDLGYDWAQEAKE
jgi:aromatic ring-opening dioxygenase catalytic subunit (LigB family)